MAVSYKELTKTNEIYTVYLIDEDDKKLNNYETLNIEHSPECGNIKINIYLERWRTCDDMVSYLDWVTDQILKFKDLKGK